MPLAACACMCAHGHQGSLNDICCCPPFWPVCGPAQQIGQLEKSIEAYEKAAQAQEKLGSPWHAAKHMETCGTISKELGAWPKVTEFYRAASELYVEAGRTAEGELGWAPCPQHPAHAPAAGSQRHARHGARWRRPVHPSATQPTTQADTYMHTSHCTSSCRVCTDCLYAGADALAKGAKLVEASSPGEATNMYKEAVTLYETDGKQAQVGGPSPA